MPTVRYGGFACELYPGESVLDGLLRSGATLAHACKAGSCGSCLLRAVDGIVPASAQTGLKDSWKARGYFLPCVCHPDGDLVTEAVGSDARVSAKIIALDRLSHDVLRVRLICDAPFEFHAGQYLTLVRDNGLGRSYSIASLPEEGVIELHVRRVANGLMSGWLYGEAIRGTQVHLQGPSGECFYVAGRHDQPLLLIGTGTGLAPLYGIVRDALKTGHSGPIHLFHGAVRPEGLYLREELQAMAAENPNFIYTPSVLQGDASTSIEIGPIGALIDRRFPDLEGWRGFVCGDPTIVQAFKKQLFLSGMAMQDIYADAFLPSAA